MLVRISSNKFISALSIKALNLMTFMQLKRTTYWTIDISLLYLNGCIVYNALSIEYIDWGWRNWYPQNVSPFHLLLWREKKVYISYIFKLNSWSWSKVTTDGSHLGPMTRFLFSDNCGFLAVERSLWWVELSLSYGRRSVDQFILVSGSTLGPMTRFYPYPFFSDNCFAVLPIGRRLWREDGSVTYSATADWSGHWWPITIHYRLIWDCVPSSSPLTARRDYSGSILTRLHTGSLSDERTGL
jgi:hypothetical protein